MENDLKEIFIEAILEALVEFTNGGVAVANDGFEDGMDDGLDLGGNVTPGGDEDDDDDGKKKDDDDKKKEPNRPEPVIPPAGI